MCGTYLNSKYEPIYDIIDFIATVTEDLNSRTLVSALWAEGGWKLKLTRVHATEYGIYGTKYLLV